jgi:hypothetical protein
MTYIPCCRSSTIVLSMLLSVSSPDIPDNCMGMFSLVKLNYKLN